MKPWRGNEAIFTAPPSLRQDRNDYSPVLLNGASGFLMKLHEVYRVVRHLLTISGGEARSFELHYRDNPIAQENAIDAQPASP
jgi:hypothetical protein